MYRLKKNAPEFEAVDGPLAGRRFEHGKNYTEVPAGDLSRFEPVEPPKQAAAAAKNKNRSASPDDTQEE